MALLRRPRKFGAVFLLRDVKSGVGEAQKLGLRDENVSLCGFPEACWARACGLILILGISPGSCWSADLQGGLDRETGRQHEACLASGDAKTLGHTAHMKQNKNKTWIVCLRPRMGGKAPKTLPVLPP